jgi:hypothetical protein
MLCAGNGFFCRLSSLNAPEIGVSAQRERKKISTVVPYCSLASQENRNMTYFFIVDEI